MNRAGTHLNSSTGTHAYPRGIKTNLLSRRRPNPAPRQCPKKTQSFGRSTSLYRPVTRTKTTCTWQTQPTVLRSSRRRATRVQRSGTCRQQRPGLQRHSRGRGQRHAVGHPRGRHGGGAAVEIHRQGHPDGCRCRLLLLKFPQGRRLRRSHR